MILGDAVPQAPCKLLKKREQNFYVFALLGARWILRLSFVKNLLNLLFFLKIVKNILTYHEICGNIIIEGFPNSAPVRLFGVGKPDVWGILGTPSECVWKPAAHRHARMPL